MSTGTVSMQVTITTPTTCWIAVFTDTFDGDWTMTEKVSSKLSFILPKNIQININCCMMCKLIVSR